MGISMSPKLGFGCGAMMSIRMKLVAGLKGLEGRRTAHGGAAAPDRGAGDGRRGAGRPDRVRRLCRLSTVSTKQDAPRGRYPSGRGAQAWFSLLPHPGLDPSRPDPAPKAANPVDPETRSEPSGGRGSSDGPPDRRVYVTRPPIKPSGPASATPAAPLDHDPPRVSGRIQEPSPSRRDG